MIRAALVELRAEYRTKLPEKLEELSDALRCAERWSEARSRAHALRGTAASYGFPAISSMAGRVEAALDGLRDAPETSAQVLSVIELEITAARAALEAENEVTR